MIVNCERDARKKQKKKRWQPLGEEMKNKSDNRMKPVILLLSLMAICDVHRLVCAPAAFGSFYSIKTKIIAFAWQRCRERESQRAATRHKLSQCVTVVRSQDKIRTLNRTHSRTRYNCIRCVHIDRRLNRQTFFPPVRQSRQCVIE